MEHGGEITDYIRNAQGRYEVHVRLPDQSTKFFPNVSRSHLEAYLQHLNAKQHGDQTEQVVEQELGKHEEHVSKFDELIESGGQIVDSYINARNLYTVQVKTPEGDTRVFPNISKDHLERYTSIDKHAHRRRLSGDTFERVMNSGGEITDIQKFSSNSVYIKMPGGNVEQFGNVSQDRLNKYKDRINLNRGVAHDRSVEHRHHKGDTFEACMEQPGATIVDVAEHPFYSVHVKTSDGITETYSHVSGRVLNKYRNDQI
jgi:hypothetical protein